MYLNPDVMGKKAIDYVRIRRMEKRDPEKIRSSLQKGLGTEHPEKIHGYAGFFWNTGNVYVSGTVAGQMEDERFRRFVWESLKRYDKGDFGMISRSDRDENIANRYLFGNAFTIGRYGYDLTDRSEDDPSAYYQVICVRTMGENTWVTDEFEPDWFLLLWDEDIEKLKDRSWPALPDPEPESAPKPEIVWGRGRVDFPD